MYKLSRYLGIGASINVAFNNDEGGFGDYGQDVAFTPYFRQYFFNKQDYGARGLFAEGLLQYTTGKDGDFVTFQQSGEALLQEEN